MYHRTENTLLINDDCVATLLAMRKDGVEIDGVITSPPYNTSRTGRSDVYNSRYEGYADNMENDEYISWITSIFVGLSFVLKKDGCILFNISYGSENTDTIWLLIANIIKHTAFTTADHIVWKKATAIPNNRSKNKLTRITESIFVFARKDEIKTFNANKKVSSIIEKTGQKSYANVYNFIEAKNTDKGEHTKTHKATFSTDLCNKLISMYFTRDSVLFDPFAGTGTLALSCIANGCKFTGTELDVNSFNCARDRIIAATEDRRIT